MVNKGVLVGLKGMCVSTEEGCVWPEHQTICASLADACLSLLEGSCIHIRMYVDACAHCGCDGVLSLCVFSCPQTPLASMEKELTFEELYLLRGIAMAKVKRKLATVEVSERHVQHRVAGM